MDGLASVTSITSLNGVDGLGELFAGGQTEVVLSGKNLAKAEAVVAVSRLLLRSETTLTKLDLRYFSWLDLRLFSQYSVPLSRCCQSLCSRL